MRFIVSFHVDVEANDSRQAAEQAKAVIASNGRIDGYDVEVEYVNEEEVEDI